MAEAAVLGAPARPAPRRAARVVARGSAFVLASTLLWHASNFAFNALGARALGPTGYGQLAAVVALLYVVSPLLYAMQATASGAVARLASADRPGDVRPELRRQARRAALWTGVAAACVAVGAGAIARALRLPSAVPVLLLLASLPLAAVVNVQRGALQGAGRFERYATSTGVEAAAKIALAVVVLLAWPGVEGAVLATAVALGCAALAHVRLLRTLPPAAPTGRPRPAARSDGATTLLSLVLLAALFSADVVVARHGMEGHAAGIYAAVSLAGKVVFFATSGLTWVLFPLLSARDERGEDGRGLLLGAVGAVVVVVAGVTAVEAIDPSLVLVPLAGHGFAGAEPWLAPAAGAFALYAIAYLLGMGLAARRSRAGVAVLVAAVAVQLAALALVTPTVGHLLAVDAAAFGLAAAGLAVVCLREGTR